MDPPPLTQPTGNEPQIFVDGDGEPLRLYVESNHMAASRSKIVRKLLRHGATTGMPPREAQIILVSEDAPESVRRSLREQAANAIMLDVGWVDHAFKRGKYAGEDEQWGGFIVPIREDSGSDGDRFYSPAQSPLQTPHSAAAALPEPAAHVPPPLQPPQQLPAQEPQPQSPATPSTTGFVPPAQHFPPSTPMQQQPQIGQDQLTQALNTVMSFLQTPQAAPTQPFIPTQQAWGVPQSAVDAQAFNLLKAAFLGPQAQQSPSQWPPFVPQTPQTPIFPPQAQPQGWQSPATPEPSSSSMPVKRRAPHQDATPSRSSGSSRQEMEDLPTRKRKQRRKSYRDDHQETSADEGDPAPSAAKTKGPFATKHGPLQFYVQVDIKNRQTVLSTIRTNGGEICSDITDANFVVLSRHAEYTKERIQEAIAADAETVNASFVTDCVAKGKLLDPEQYGFHDLSVKSKRGRYVTIDMADLRRAHEEELAAKAKRRERKRERHRERERDTPEEEEPMDGAYGTRYIEQDTDMSNGNTAGPSKNRRNNSTPARVKRESQDTPSRSYTPNVSRSPSPEPPSNVVQYVSGRNLFSAEERAWFAKYLPHLLKYSPNMSNTEIAKRLAQKVPAHTAGSWATFVGNQREDLQKARKHANIQARKRQLDEERRRTHENLAHDIECITQYLSEGGANDKQDSEVWEELQAKNPCRTAPSWEEFWRIHGAEIATRISALQEVQTG